MSEKAGFSRRGKRSGSRVIFSYLVSYTSAGLHHLSENTRREIRGYEKCKDLKAFAAQELRTFKRKGTVACT